MEICWGEGETRSEWECHRHPPPQQLGHTPPRLQSFSLGLTGSQGLRRSVAGPRRTRAVEAERRSDARPRCPPARAGRFEGRKEAEPPVSGRAGGHRGHPLLCTHLLGVPGLQRMLVVIEGLFDGRHLEKKHWWGGGEWGGQRREGGTAHPHPPGGITSTTKGSLGPPHPACCPESLGAARGWDTQGGAHLYCPRPHRENLQERR